MNERGLRVRLFTVVRDSAIAPTRPITEMQSGIRCRHRTDEYHRNTQRRTTTHQTSSGLQATGKSVTRPELTGSSLRNC